MEPNLNLEELRRERRRLLESFARDPETTAKTFYTFIGSRLYSPYLSLNRRDLCCVFNRGVPMEETPGLCLAPFREIGSGAHGTIYSVGTREESYVLKERDVTKPVVAYLEQSERTQRRLNPYRGVCGFPLSFPSLALASDDFTNEVLISYILDELLDRQGVREAGLNNIATTYAASICGKNKGLLLMERGEASLNDVNNAVFSPYQEFGFTISGEIPVFNEYFILNTIGQVVLILQYLDNWNFVHGDLKLANVAFFSTPYDYYQADFTVKLIDFEKSSVTYSLENTDHRFFNYSSLADTYLSLLPFTPNVKDGTFIIDATFVPQIYAYSRHDLTPYYSSFDLYTFIISMLLSPSYFFAFSRFPNLVKSVFRVLFDEDNFVKIYDRIYKAQGKLDPDSMSDILDILRGVPLKCNLADLLYKSIFTGGS
ncbi:Hypothetical protein BRZCDTV_180 [Brazilian cedratvirus IHUMI]|uniref:Protein kinase domain-containing protein n=1 Tax=Brazilian cedratvirus IHUMI TaxID=2126980 RepID=A0A2R8FDT0_9VIRU|nr:Hypothetical protein BRZCDTV_180 [Brazilian cedratvirus IHUMI]